MWRAAGGAGGPHTQSFAWSATNAATAWARSHAGHDVTANRHPGCGHAVCVSARSRQFGQVVVFAVGIGAAPLWVLVAEASTRSCWQASGA